MQTSRLAVTLEFNARGVHRRACRVDAAICAFFALFVFTWFALPAYASRPVPRLVVPAAERPVELRKLSASVDISGSMARTTLEMVFYNPNSRVLEGELQFPLADGQQVMGFALDIDGKLRDAVVVEKTRGQQVFEDITRRRVDPGLLQATQGNNFKLRVYPIFAQRTRTVSITYVESLASRGRDRVYTLPLDYASTIDVVEVEIRASGARPRLSGAAASELSFARGMDGRMRATRVAYAARGVLEVAVDASRQIRVLTQELDSSHYFHAEVPIVPRKAARELPNRIGVVWDSSASGASRNHTRELALLDAYFAAVGNADVHLVRVRDTAEPAERFEIVNGRWDALRRALEQTVYDGATNLGAFVPNAAMKEYLLFSDGLHNYGEDAFAKMRVPVHSVNAAAQANPTWLKHLAARSGGRYLDLNVDTPAAAAEALLFEHERIKSISAIGAAELVTSSAYPANGMIAVGGLMTAPQAEVSVELELAGERPRIVRWPVRERMAEGAFAAPLWARERVAALEADPAANRSDILKVARKFGLVTRETSLIVLETVADYARFEIEPPRELAAQYERMRASMRRTQPETREQKIERVVAMLDAKAAWWKTDFPKGPVPVAAPPAPFRHAPARSVKESTAAYLVDSQGAPVRAEGAGVCVRNGQWAPATAVSQCEPDMMPKLAPPPPPPPPKPMAKPAMAKPAMPVRPSSAAAAVARPTGTWSPTATYRKRFEDAATAEIYPLYLEERPRNADVPTFYMDVADVLFARGERDLALRVLSNLAEIDLENRHILRSLGARLLEAKEPHLAVAVYNRVLAMAPEEPQSFRDLGLALAAAGETQRAVDTLYEVVAGAWHFRFPEIELIALADLNAIAANSDTALDLSRVDARLLRNLALDLRIVLTWDADNSNVDLLVTDPNGHTMRPSSPGSYQGGRMSHNFTGGYGPEEFSLREAKPGSYRVTALLASDQRQVAGAGPVHGRVHVYRKFGTGEQDVEIYNVLLPRPGSSTNINAIEIR